MQVIRKSDFNAARYIIGEVIGTKGKRVEVKWSHSHSTLLPSSLVELDEAKLQDLQERVSQRKAKENIERMKARPFVCVNVNPQTRVDHEGHRKPLNLLPSQVKEGKCYYCGAVVVNRCLKCENPATANSDYCEQCQRDLAGQNQEEK